MPVAYGRLDWFLDQGMEGNAAPVFLDASKMSLNKFGVVEAGYQNMILLEDGMHLTVYTEPCIYKHTYETLAEKGLNLPRFFEKELELTESYIGGEMPIRIIHDTSMGTMPETLWVQEQFILHRFKQPSEIVWRPDRPCEDSHGSISYTQDNPLVDFYTDRELYIQEIRNIRESFFPDQVISELETADDWDNKLTFLPPWQIWRWMFLQELCARLEY